MTAVDFMFRVQQFPPDDMLLTSCPKCQHTFPLPSPCCQQPQQQHQQPLVVSATLHLPPSPTPTSCTVTVCQVGMTGGGLVDCSGGRGDSIILQRGLTGGKLTVNCHTPSPEPSPSDPVAFVIPTPEPAPTSPLHYKNVQRWSYPAAETDLLRLSWTQRALRLSGWYYEGLSWQESATLLMPTAPGTFLVRDSSDPRFLFSLSVQTERGPTSVRLHYRDGHFRLDAAAKLVPVMPVFPCVVALVQYYVSVTSEKARTGKSASGREQVWIDCSGQTYSSILLTRPLYQRARFPSLQHLARLAVHKHNVPTTDLPESLNAYLADYPYSL